MQRLLAILVVIAMLAGGVFYFYYTAQQKVMAPGLKTGEASLRGSIYEANGKFYLNSARQSPVELDSYSLDLSQYAGQEVNLTGQYSGDKLFVNGID